MSFANSIRGGAVPEWRDFYVSYDKLRAKMRQRDFQTMLNGELTKINNFYFLLEKKAVDEKNKIFDDVFAELPEENFEDLRAQTEDTGDEEETRRASAGGRGEETEDVECHFGRGLETEDEDRCSSESGDTMRHRRRQIDSGLRRFMKMPRGITRRKKEKNITEFLHSLIKIIAYRDLNASALLKLAKRHSRLRKNAAFLEEFTRKLKAAYFYKSNRIELIRAAIKRLYKRIFAKNQPEKARMVFSRIKRGLKSSDWLFILSGFLTGASYTLALVREFPGRDNALFWAVLNIYFGFLLFGLTLKVFKSMQINYKFIFNFDVCSSMNNALYLLLVSSLLSLHVVGFLAGDALLAGARALAPYRLCLVGAQALVLLLPCDLLFYNSRIYLLGVYAHAIFQPLSTIRFRHFYFIDVAQSFSFSIKQILAACGVSNAYVLNALVTLFPIIRILQCLKRYTTSKLAFPHIMNCAKFTMGIVFNLSRFAESFDRSYASFSVFFGVLNFVSGISWDLLMDWHIVRSRYMYPQAVYVLIIAFGVFTRLLWVHRYLLDAEFPVLESLAEVTRRFLWTLIRVEVEHLNNCDELRTKSVINLTAGELFYKKDQEEVFPPQSETGAETEDETEDEAGFATRDEPESESMPWESNGYESCDEAI